AARVPQMADTGEVIGALGDLPGVIGTALVPNTRGLAAFLETREAVPLLGEVAVFVSATEGFSQANLRCSVEESLGRAAAVVSGLPEGVQIRGYISCVTDCPFEGHVAPDAVARVAERLKDLGCHTLSLGDTIGKGTPERVADMLTAVLGVWPAALLAAHFHDTVGLALENVDVAVEAGLRSFDSSVAGLGGCPYAPGAPGNLATEALLERATARGWETGIDGAKLAQAADLARKIVGRNHGH
ncbi:MAG: hydroxymethylglutaryl-CoA lyase, partial [Pseudomonadota bacterium]